MSFIESKVHQQLQNGSVWYSRDCVHPDDGLRNALRTETADRACYVEALRQRLGSTDLRQRTGAIALLDEILPDIGADRALAALRAVPLEPSQQPTWPIGGADLEQAAASALAANATAADTDTIDWVKQLAVERDYRVFLLAHLARLDSDWIFENIKLVSHGNLSILTALPVDRREAFIDALAPWPLEEPSQLSRAFWKRLPPAEAARLRSRMWPG